MERMPREHWDHIYSTKELKELSWFQPKPQTSIDLILNSGISKDAKIIDVGGGDSFLVDNLLELGYTNITVLDISKIAIEKAKKRLGKDADKITWIVSNVTQFKPEQEYDLWHDRAAFHFLLEAKHINFYSRNVFNSLKPTGIFILGTFSKNGPEKCSQLPVTRYSTTELTNLFKGDFKEIQKMQHIHKTPFETNQEFSFVQLQKE